MNLVVHGGAAASSTVVGNVVVGTVADGNTVDSIAGGKTMRRCIL